MTFDDNFSLTRLFMTKDVLIVVNKHAFTLHLKSVKDMYIDNDWNASYHLWSKSLEQQQKICTLKITSSFDFISKIVFILGAYDFYSDTAKAFVKELKDLLPTLTIDYKNSEFRVTKDVVLNEDIWNYIMYILKKAFGEKTEKPRTFSTKAEKQFYLAQKEREARIAKIRGNSNSHDSEALGKILLSINYAFPGLSIDYLINQTMAQIQWLQKYAAGAMSYEVNAKAFAAGNVKKNSKLKFFIE